MGRGRVLPWREDGVQDVLSLRHCSGRLGSFTLLALGAGDQDRIVIPHERVDGGYHCTTPAAASVASSLLPLFLCLPSATVLVSPCSPFLPPIEPLLTKGT